MAQHASEKRRFWLQSPHQSGWLAGMLAGLCLTLCFLPAVHTLFLAQLQFALPASPAVFSGPIPYSARQMRVLSRTADKYPDDYLLQVGRATVLFSASRQQRRKDHTLLRMVRLADLFPLSPGVYAMLVRYLTTDHMGEQSKTPLSPLTLNLLEHVITRGKHLDPDNAFWPVMQAALELREGSTSLALRDFSAIRTTSHWDAYLYEQVIGQWRLYSLAYGNHGAAQKVAPLSMIGFPYLQIVRHMALQMQTIAEQRALHGKTDQAVNIRHQIARLGQILRNTAPWSYEALFGTDLTLIASTDKGASTLHLFYSGSWPRLAHRYLALLRKAHRKPEEEWMMHQVEKSLRLRRRMNLARYDASYPGVPPGIPLAPLFGLWMTGVCLLRQLGAFVLTALFLAVLPCLPIRAVRIALPVVFALTAAAALLFCKSIGSEPVGSALLVFSALSLLLWLELYANSRRKTNWAGRGAPRFSLQNQEAMLICLLILLAADTLLLWMLQPFLASQHPVAHLLSLIAGEQTRSTILDVLTMLSLQLALPLLLPVALACTTLHSSIRPLHMAQRTMKQMFLPASVALLILYLLSAQTTLRLDNRASNALSQAALNDRQWVLTHTPAQ